MNCGTVKRTVAQDIANIILFLKLNSYIILANFSVLHFYGLPFLQHVSLQNNKDTILYNHNKPVILSYKYFCTPPHSD